MGTLYLVATPIGNLEDITLRALRVLREVSLVAAEDTRSARFLLDHYGIQVPLTSFFEHNEVTKLDLVLNALATGDVALISEAGTPGLSDPGYRLVVAAIAAGYPVVPVPGPSAVTAALVASGLPTDGFLFLGFLPRKRAARQRFLAEVAQERRTLVAFEAPHRLLSSLRDIRAVLGNRPMAVARELTKLFEEIRRGTVEEMLAHFQAEPPRGEITLVIGGRTEEETAEWPEERVRQALTALLAEGMAKGEAAKLVASEAHWPRRRVYELAVSLASASSDSQ